MHREQRHLRRLAIVILLGLGLSLVLSAPGAAQDAPGAPVGGTDDAGQAPSDPDEDSCGWSPGPVAAICDASGSANVPVVETEVSLFEAAAITFWRQLVEWFAAGLRMLLDGLVFAATRTTQINLSADWFVEQFNGVLRIGGLVMLPLFLAAIIRGLLVDRAEMTRAVTRLPVAALLTVLAIPAAQFFVATIDALSSGYQAGLGSSVEELTVLLGAAAEPLVTPTTVAGGGLQVIGGAAFGFLLAAIFLIFATFVVWLELVLRQAGVYLLVLFLPLAFAGLVWTPTRSWLAKMAQAFVALVVSKFVIVVVLSTAAAALKAMASDWVAGPVSAETASTLEAADPSELLSLLALGVALIGLAAFAPYTVWRLIPIATASAAGAFEGVLRRPTAAVGRPHPVDATYNKVAQLDRAKLLKDRLTSGGTSSLARGGAARAAPSRGGAAAGAGGGGAGAAGPAAAAAAAVAVASKAKQTTTAKVHRLPDRGGEAAG